MRTTTVRVGPIALGLFPLLALGIAACSGGEAGASDSTRNLCVDTINQYRATLGLAPYQAASEEDGCADGEAASDSQTGKAHGAFGACGEHAQDECPGWAGADEGAAVVSCLQMMWSEGPGSDFSTHGHYLNMSSTQYTKAVCGFHMTSSGSLWAVQDFY